MTNVFLSQAEVCMCVCGGGGGGEGRYVRACVKLCVYVCSHTRVCDSSSVGKGGGGVRGLEANTPTGKGLRA